MILLTRENNIFDLIYKQDFYHYGTENMEINNRELAIFIWLMVLVGTMATKANFRQALCGVVSSFFVPPILWSIALAAIYIILEVTVLATIGIWQWPNLKTTLLWAASFAILTMFDINRVSEDDMFFRNTIREVVGFTAIITFIAEFYTFGFFTEFILAPILAALAAMNVLSHSRADFSKVAVLLDWALGLFGLGLVGYEIYLISQHFSEFATMNTLREFFIPIALSILYLPFLYILSVCMVYERIFVSLKYTFKDQPLRRYAKIRAIQAFGFDLKWLRRWFRHIAIFNPDSRQDVLNSIQEIKEVKRQEKNPPQVSPLDGWSPYEAKKFLTKDGMVTGDYHRSIDGWIASSPYKEIGGGILPDNIAYYVEGDNTAAKCLKLILNINNPNHPHASEQEFLVIAQNLLRRSIGEKAARWLTQTTLLKGNAHASLLGRTISLSRVDWMGGIKGGYQRRLIINVSPR